jgi:integrase
VTFHDLRHDDASLLIRHGESVKAMQKRLGHKSAVETLETYSPPLARFRGPDPRGGRRGPWLDGRRTGAEMAR